MFTQNTVTLITAATGHPNLPQCLRSVQDQTFEGVEHLVVIDGPEHESAVEAAIGGLPARKRPIHLLTLPFATGKEKWNGHRIYAAGSYLANTEFVGFLDADNWLESDHVERLLATIRQTSAPWAFALRNIIDLQGKFIARDECESLGNLHACFYDPAFHHVDTNCYLLRREVAVNAAHIWYGPTKPPDWRQEPDRLLCRYLLGYFPQAASSRGYTVNYTVASRSDSVRPEFFLKGNAAMHAAYPGGLPWAIP
jgi:hypothetical protein